jgi:heat-inducible transcriptional repressor
MLRSAEHAAGPAFGLLALTLSFATDVLRDQEKAERLCLRRDQSAAAAGISGCGQGAEAAVLPLRDQKLALLPRRTPTPAADPYRPGKRGRRAKDTSVVIASYDIGDNMRGLIGVVGPTRMDYARVAARLSYLPTA